VYGKEELAAQVYQEKFPPAAYSEYRTTGDFSEETGGVGMTNRALPENKCIMYGCAYDGMMQLAGGVLYFWQFWHMLYNSIF